MQLNDNKDRSGRSAGSIKSHSGSRWYNPEPPKLGSLNELGILSIISSNIASDSNLNNFNLVK